MVRSMTGYGRAEKIIDGKDILVEIKSINHRFFDFTARLPRNYMYLEDKLKNLVMESISRGKVEMFVTVNTIEGASEEVSINHALAENYINVLNETAERFGLRNDVSVMGLTRFTDIFVISKATEDEEKVWSAVKSVAEEAISAFVAMRGVEGEKLKKDVRSRGKAILGMVESVEKRSPEIVSAYRQRLEEKIAQVLEEKNIDEARIVTEAAVFADKIAVDEETVRLRSHMAQLEMMLECGEPIGRKLDFLIQEINREVNTIGSKNSDLTITNTVVEMKSEIEKIREQIQNIE